MSGPSRTATRQRWAFKISRPYYGGSVREVANLQNRRQHKNSQIQKGQFVWHSEWYLGYWVFSRKLWNLWNSPELLVHLKRGGRFLTEGHWSVGLVLIFETLQQKPRIPWNETLFGWSSYHVYHPMAPNNATKTGNLRHRYYTTLGWWFQPRVKIPSFQKNVQDSRSPHL